MASYIPLHAPHTARRPDDEAAAAYREVVDEHPERSVKLGVRF